MSDCVIQGCKNSTEGARGYCGAHYRRLRLYGDPMIGGVLKTSRGEPRKWLERHASFQGDECLEWPFVKFRGGYGSLLVGGARTTAHRFMCVLAHGDPPSDTMQAAHSCNNRACCNPRHLRWATVKENHADKLVHGTHARGENNTRARITRAQVLAILRDLKIHPASEVARRHKVSRSTVTSIQHGCSWSWLTGRNRGSGRDKAA